jgi:hypothetical protein
MAKSKGRLLAELLASDGKVKESKSALDIAGGKLSPDDIPTLPNSKLENSSISIAGHSTSLGESVSLNTGDITEHTNYKYYTEGRVRSAISASGDLSYNSSTGVISFSATASPVISVNSETGSVVLDTGDIAENGNLYHTTARARAAISATGSLSYNSTTGVISFTMPAQNTSNITEGSNKYYTDARVGSYLSTNGYATQSTIIGAITDSAPATLDTLNELAAALGDDANFSTTVTNSIGTKWTQNNTKIGQWDTAYGWGNHANAGYLTSYTEADTLATVTGRGASTSTDITISAAGRTLYNSNSHAYIQVGPSGGGAAGTFGAHRLTTSSALDYTTYIGYDTFYSDTTQKWHALRSNLGRKWKVNFGGYHQNKFTIGTYDGGGTSGSSLTAGWLEADWTERFTVDASGGNGVKVLGNTVWHAGNDGSGSTLDADLLDGQQGSYYAAASSIPTNNNQLTNGAGYITDGNTNWNNSYGFITASDSSITSKLPLAGGTLTGAITATSFYLNDTNTRLHEASGNALRITTGTGYIDIGSKNSGWIHFEGNKPYYFNQALNMDADLKPYNTSGARNLGTTGNVWNHVYAKGYFIDSTEVIDSSRNLTNIGTISATGGNSTNWNTAYGWGNHASAGYVTSSGNTVIGTDTDLSFSGANVLSTIALTDGVITSYTNRVLTLANLGYTGETNATADQSAAEILTLLKTVDTNTSGLNSDTLDGVQLDNIVYGNYKGTFAGVTMDANAVNRTGTYTSSAFTNRPAGTSWTYLDTKRLYSNGNDYHKQIAYDTYNNNMWTRTNSGGTWSSWYKMWNSFNDGSGSGLDADLLDGQHGSYYLAYANLTGTPTIPSLSGYATESYVGTQISNLVDSSPAALNTLNELAAAIGDDANFSTTVTNNIATKLPLAGGTLTGALQAQPWLFRSMSNQVEYHVLDNGSLNGPSWKFRYDGATANRYVDFGYKDGNGSYTSGLKLYNNQIISWKGTDIINASAQWTGGIASSGYNNSNWNTAYGWGNHASAGYYAASNPSGYTTYTANQAVNNNSVVTFNQVYATNNGAGTNYKIGDDVWIGDINVANTFRVQGSQNPNAGYITFGNSSNAQLGRTGTGALTWDSGIVWYSGNDGSGSTLDADLLDGQHGSYYMPASTTTITESHRVSGNAFATTGSPGSVLEYQQASGQTDTRLAPSSDWHNTIRMGHGNPYNYYSNTIAARMTGSGVGDLYTQSIHNNTANGWRKVWSAGNDGAGSGLDADLLDGQHASAFATLSGSNSFTNSYNEFGNSTGSVSNDGGWNARVNIAGSSHARLDVKSVSDGIITSIIAHTGNAAGKVGTYSNHPLHLMINGSSKAVLSTAGSLSTTPQGTLWGASNDGSGSGLDADLLDGQHGSFYANEDARKSVPSSGNYQITNSTSPQTLGTGYLRHDFLNSSGPPGSNYRSVLSISSYTSGSQWTQLSFNYNNGINTPIYFRQNQYNGSTWSSWHQLWDSVNDGAGSGLDADLLDGQQGSYYAPNSSLGNYVAKNANTMTGSAFKLGFHSGSGGTTFGTSHYSMGVDIANGGWSGSNYSDLIIGYHTGIRIGAGYSGIRFYNNSPTSDTNNTGNGNGGESLLMTIGGGGTTTSGTHVTVNNDLVAGSIRSDNFQENAGTFLFKKGTGSGRHRHLNLANTTSDPASVTDAQNPTGISWGQRTDNNGYYMLGIKGQYNNGSSNHSRLAIAWHTGVEIGASPSYGGTRFFSDSPYMSTTEIMSVGKGDGHVRVANNLYANGGNLVWNGSNDGSGSGLDADLLDGQQGSYYYQASNPSGYLRNASSETISYVYRIHTSDSTTPDSFGYDNRYQTFNYGVSSGITGPLITFGGLGSGYPMQLTGAYSSGGAGIKYRTRNGDSASWNSWYTLWHNGNDGAGSGLDADLLDGQQGSYYLPTTGKAADSELLDGIDSARVVYASGTNAMGASRVGFASLTNSRAGFYDVYNSGTPTGTWYSLVNMPHSSSNHGHQIAGSFYSAGDIYNRNNNNTTLSAWAKIWNTANDGAGSGLDADLLDGYNSSMGATANTVVVRDSNAHITGNYILGSYFNASSGNNENPTIGQVWTQSTGDNYLRKSTPAHFASQMGSHLVRTDGSNAAFVKVPANYTGNLNSISNAGVYFTEGTGSISNNPFGTSGSFLQFGDAGGTDVRLQFYAKSSLDRIAFRNQWGNNNWGGWHEFWTTANDGSGSGLDADTVDGRHLQQIARYQSGNDFANGTLVTTNIAASGTNGDSFVIEITGKAYGSSRPHSVIAEGYLYNNTIINTNGTNISGSNFTYLKVMSNGGYLSFWWPRHGYWNSYDVHVRASSTGTGNYNRVTAITNSVDPSGATKKIQINLATSWNSSNDGSGSGLDADLLDGIDSASFARRDAQNTFSSAANYFLSNRNTTSNSPPLQAYSTGNNGAIMSFHKSGHYAINMGLDSDTVFRIGGWSAATNRLQMNMSGDLTMAGNVTAYSDIRLKENIKVIPDALNKVQQLRGVTFTRNDVEDLEKLHTGVIAQEVEVVLPEAVSEDNDGIKNVAYGNMVGLLIEAIKELKDEVNELKRQIKEK